MTHVARPAGEAETGCSLLRVPDPTGLGDFEVLAGKFSRVRIDLVRRGDKAAGAHLVSAWNTASTELWSMAKQECGAELQLKLPFALVAQRLSRAAAEAPFSLLAESADSDEQGLALFLIDQLREMVVGAVPVVPPRAPTASAHMAGPELVRVVSLLRYLTEVSADPSLQRLTVAFDLTNRQLADLFGVTPTAIGQWRQSGVPSHRQAKLVVVEAIVDILGYRLKAGRLPGVARKRAMAYGGRTMLEMIADDEHEQLLESVRISFDYARPA